MVSVDMQTLLTCVEHRYLIDHAYYVFACFTHESLSPASVLSVALYLDLSICNYHYMAILYSCCTCMVNLMIGLSQSLIVTRNYQKLVVPNSSSPGLPDNDSGTESVQTNQLWRKNACKTLWWCWHALYFTKKTHSETDISNEQLRWMQTCMQHCPKTCVPISGIPRGIWHVLMEQALIPGAKSCVPSLHIHYKYPISPCCRRCVAGRYGCLDVTILTEYPPLGEDSDGKSPPPFFNICPRYARWAIQWIGALSCCQSH